MANNKKILFIIHEASLTGAPLLILDLIRVLKESGFDIGVLLDRGGVIEDKFKESCPTFILKHSRYGKRTYFIQKIVDYGLLRIRLIKCKKFVKEYDVVFSNTIANGRLLLQLASLKKPVITYVHELPSVVDFYNRTGDFQGTVAVTQKWVFPAAFIKEVYQTKYNIAAGFILNYVKSDFQKSAVIKEDARMQLAERYKLPIEKLWVVAMGTTTKRKGVDLFIEIAEAAVARRGDMHFVWVGPFSEEFQEQDLDKLVSSRDMGGSISFIGPVPPNDRFLSSFDLFLLTSREDPYPLVVLEAAMNRCPVFSFENGGIVSFLADGCGLVTSGINTQEMISNLLQFDPKDPSIISMKENAYKKIVTEHLNKQRVHDQFVEIINCQ